MSSFRWPTYVTLLAAKYLSRSLWRARTEWVGDVPEDPWQDVRLIAILHHTSLAEPVYLPAVPNRVLRKVARHGVAPIANETMARPILGRVFRLLVANPVAITRRRDDTWERVMARVDDPEAMIALCPEGRMMRPNGRDKAGEPMTIKPGIAQVLRSLGRGRMILAYSGGLHHVFPPGARLPRPFRPMKLRVESIDIASYVAERMREGPSYVEAVVRDLTRRRDLYTPIAPGTPAAVTAEVVRRRQAAWQERVRRRAAAAPDTASGQPPGAAAAGAGGTTGRIPL
jgi:1-acyl-sn-glycerol-3-phosphate acyltransferase